MYKSYHIICVCVYNDTKINHVPGKSHGSHLYRSTSAMMSSSIERPVIFLSK